MSTLPEPIRLLAQDHPSPIWIISPQLDTLLYVNLAAKDLLGDRLKDNAEPTIDIILHSILPEDQQKYKDHIHSLRSYPNDFPLINKKTNYRAQFGEHCVSLQEHCTAITHDDELSGFLCICHAHKPTQSHEASSKRDIIVPKYFYEIASKSRDILWIKNNTFTGFEYISPSIHALCAIEPGVICSDTSAYLKIIHPEDRQKVSEYYHQITNKLPQKSYNIQYRINTPLGQTKLVDETIVTIEGADNCLEGFAGIIIDVTSKKKRLKELEDASYYFRYFAKESNSVFWVRDPMGKKQLYLSPSYERIWGQSCETLYNNPSEWNNNVIAEDLDENLMQHRVDDVLAGKLKHYNNKFRIKRPNGEIRYISDINFPIKNDAGEIIAFAGIANDITSDVMKEQELIATKELAEAANQAKGAFLAVVSHELRTPLHGISGLAQVIQNETQESKTKKLIDHIISSSSHLNSLLNDILDYTSSSAVDFKIKPKPINLYELLVANIDELQHNTLAKGVPLTLQYLGNKNINVQADKKRIQQVLHNLIFNAIKFTQQGYILVKVSVTEKSNDAQTLIQVIDTGIGIKQQDIKRIFERFEQGSDNSPYINLHSGLGLGLPITKTLVEKMGGTIEASSTVNKGSTFSVNLNFPICQAREEPSAGSSVTERLPQSFQILVVEDETINQIVISSMLKQLNQSYNIVNCGHKALTEIQKKSYDLVLMDIGLPDITGIEVTRSIRKLPGYENIPIIALTAHAFDKNKNECLEAGINAVLIKPLMIEALSNIIARWCQRT